MDLNVTLSKNPPDHDSHCVGVLYSLDGEGFFFFYSHTRVALQKRKATATVLICDHLSSRKTKCHGYRQVSV